MKIQKEIREIIFIEYDGLRFYPDKKGYWINGKTIKNKRKLTRLHIYVYEKYFGKIPNGYHVHHIDMDKNNNDISNLQLMLETEHLKLHAENVSKEYKEKRKKNFELKARPKAIEWHKSKDGIEWHKEQYQKTKEFLHDKKQFVCSFCEKEFETVSNGRNQFCSNYCKNANRRKLCLDKVNRKCEHCGIDRFINKYSKSKYCVKCSRGLRKENK